MLDIGNELIGTKMEEITVESLTNRVYHSLQLKYAITIRPCMVNALVLPLRAYFTAEDNFWFSVDVILGYVRYLFSFLKPVGKFERPRVQSLGPDRLRSVSYPVLRTFCPLYWPVHQLNSVINCDTIHFRHPFGSTHCQITCSTKFRCFDCWILNGMAPTASARAVIIFDRSWWNLHRWTGTKQNHISARKKLKKQWQITA